jgi:hypothetical protein
MKSFHLTRLLVLLVLLALAVVAFAAPPQTINYQGYLKNTAGTPVNAATTLTFSIYSSTSGAGPVWSEQKSVNVSNGIYSTRLGTITPLTLGFGRQLYLGVRVESDPEMRPLQPLASVPSAYRAALADSVPNSSIGTSAISDNSITSAKIADASVTAAKLDTAYVKLSGDTMTGSLNISSGNLALPATSGTGGIIYSGGSPFIHGFGTYNFFAGSGSGNLTMAGSYNTATGAGALAADTTGSFNAASGLAALMGNTKGDRNTASGAQALKSNTEGNRNTALGFLAGDTLTTANANTTGSDNTFIGAFSGPGTTTQLTNATAIGANALVSASNSMVLGGTGVNVGIGTTAPAERLEVVGTVKAANFSGDGAGLSNVPVGLHSHSATDITNGTMADARLSANIDLLNAVQTVSGAKTFSAPLTSTVINGTAPLQVASTTLVPNLNADMLDGQHAAAFQNKYGKVAVVAQSGGDYTNPITAMTGLASWCGTPSSNNPCLLKIMPGRYTVTSAVVMQPYVDIEGSGEKVTKITAALISATNPPSVATVMGANNAALRFLTVENTGTGISTAAILNTSASPSVIHVTATASGGASVNYGFFNNNSSAPKMTNVTATASGGTIDAAGVYNTGSSSPMMTNVTATASGATNTYGVHNDASSSPTMTNVTANASGGINLTNGVYNSTSSPTMMSVTATASGGTSVNNGVYNTTSSPTMMSVTATASGGTNAYGVRNADSSSPTMTNVIATASGGSNVNNGVYNQNTSSPMMTNIIVTALGVGSVGVNNSSSSPTMTNVTASASGASSVGVSSSFSGTVKINNSVIKGTLGTISNFSGVTTRVGNTKLDGGAAISNPGGTLTCAGVYDENYIFYASTCP